MNSAKQVASSDDLNVIDGGHWLMCDSEQNSICSELTITQGTLFRVPWDMSMLLERSTYFVGDACYGGPSVSKAAFQPSERNLVMKTIKEYA